MAVLAGDDSWRDKADRLIAAIAPLIAENLYMHMAMLNAIDLRLRGAEIIVTGEGEGADALLKAARRLPSLDRIVLHAASAEALPASHPARDKLAGAREPQAFVCIGETCSLPATDPAALTGWSDSGFQVLSPRIGVGGEGSGTDVGDLALARCRVRGGAVAPRIDHGGTLPSRRARRVVHHAAGPG